MDQFQGRFLVEDHATAFALDGHYGVTWLAGQIIDCAAIEIVGNDLDGVWSGANGPCELRLCLVGHVSSFPRSHRSTRDTAHAAVAYRAKFSPGQDFRSSRRRRIYSWSEAAPEMVYASGRCSGFADGSWYVSFPSLTHGSGKSSRSAAALIS